MQQAQSELRTQEVAIATRQGEFNALQNSQRLLHQKIDTVVYEIQSLAGQEQEGVRKRRILGDQTGELENGSVRCNEQLTDLNGRLEDLRQQRDLLNAAVTEAKVALAREEQLCASFRNQQPPLEQRIRELVLLVEERRGEIASVINRQSQAEVEIEESRRTITAVQHEREQVNARQSGC